MQCLLCNREFKELTEHHLIPREFKGKETINICNDCHNAIHARYSNKELRDNFYTLELLKADLDLIKAFKFLSKQDTSKRFTSRQSNNRGKKGKYG